MKRATDPEGKTIKGEKGLEAPDCHGEPDAGLSGDLVVCVLNYRQLSVVSLLALKNLEPRQKETWSIRREILLHLLTLCQPCRGQPLQDAVYSWDLTNSCWWESVEGSFSLQGHMLWWGYTGAVNMRSDFEDWHKSHLTSCLPSSSLSMREEATFVHKPAAYCSPRWSGSTRLWSLVWFLKEKMTLWSINSSVNYTSLYPWGMVPFHVCIWTVSNEN